MHPLRPILIVDADADAHRPFPSMRVFFGILQSLWDQNTRTDWNFRREIRVRAEIVQIFADFFQKSVRNFCARMEFSHSKWDPRKNQTGAMVCHPTLNLVQIPIYLAGATITHILYYTSGIPFLTAVAMTTRRKKPSQDETTSSVNATKMPSKKATTSISLRLKKEMRSVIAVRCYDYIFSRLKNMSGGTMGNCLSSLW